jgi:hypothetical protein
MNPAFYPLSFEWAPVTDMKKTPKTWYNYYDSVLITSTNNKQGTQTESIITPMTVPSVAQLRNISDSRYISQNKKSQ